MFIHVYNAYHFEVILHAKHLSNLIYITLALTTTRPKVMLSYVPYATCKTN